MNQRLACALVGVSGLLASCAAEPLRANPDGSPNTTFDGTYDGRYGPAGGFCDQVGTHGARLVVKNGIGRLSRAGMGWGEGLGSGGVLRYHAEPIAADGSFRTHGPTYHVTGQISGDRFTAIAVQISGMPCNLSFDTTKVAPGIRLLPLNRNVLAPDQDAVP